MRFLLCLTLLVLGSGTIRAEEDFVSLEIPEPLRTLVHSWSCSKLGGLAPEVTMEESEPNMTHVRLTFELPQPLGQDDWRINIAPAFDPRFHWSPHLTPTDDHIVDQHSFRSPAVFASSDRHVLALIPDLDVLSKATPVRWYLDLDAERNHLTLGMSDYDTSDKLLYVRKPGATYPAGKVEVGFYLLHTSNEESIENPFRPILGFLWRNWGRALFESGQPLGGDLLPYVDHTYRWAFESWKKSVWQELEWKGTRVGAPVFIVNQTQSPNYSGAVDEREFRSIWNQAWFSSLRSASGLYRYARRFDRADLLEKAEMTKELALSAPMREGFFPSVIATEMEEVEIDGEQYNRSKGWSDGLLG